MVHKEIIQERKVQEEWMKILFSPMLSEKDDNWKCSAVLIDYYLMYIFLETDSIQQYAS